MIYLIKSKDLKISNLTWKYGIWLKFILINKLIQSNQINKINQVKQAHHRTDFSPVNPVTDVLCKRMSSSKPLIEGKTARVQPSFQVYNFRNNESKIRRQIPGKLINLFFWWGWGENTTMLLSTKLFDQLTVVAAQLQYCYQPPQPVSFFAPRSGQALILKKFRLGMGMPGPLKDNQGSRK